LTFGKLPHNEAFQGVEAIGDVAPKTGDNPLSKHWQLAEREERDVTATIQATGNLRNDQQSEGIPPLPWKASNMSNMDL